MSKEGEVKQIRDIAEQASVGNQEAYSKIYKLFGAVSSAELRGIVLGITFALGSLQSEPDTGIDLLKDLIEAFPQVDPDSELYDQEISGSAAVDFLSDLIPEVRKYLNQGK